VATSGGRVEQLVSGRGRLRAIQSVQFILSFFLAARRFFDEVEGVFSPALLRVGEELVEELDESL
jgi:hypothetical protein